MITLTKPDLLILIYFKIQNFYSQKQSYNYIQYNYLALAAP